MIPRLGGFLSVCALVSAAFASEANVAGPSATDVKQQLIDLEEVWVTAENTHDTATLHRILDDRFVATWASGKTVDKEAFIKGVTSGDINPTMTQTLTDRTFLIDGDTAVVVETDTVRSTKDGKETIKVYRITVTYIRRNGRWTALAEHMVKVPPDK